MLALFKAMTMHSIKYIQCTQIMEDEQFIMSKMD